jgi:methylated-DNA-[protein]-cysteine S-methyltransferase
VPAGAPGRPAAGITWVPVPDAPEGRCTVATPIGRFVLAGRAGVLTGVALAAHGRGPDLDPDGGPGGGSEAGPDEAARQLAAYFDGTRTSFDLEVAADGTAFQLAVWQALGTIPYGATATYGELAARVGRPGAQRAVGSANRANPLSLVVPCHRVIAAGGALSGYGWGPERKAWLLAHERGETPPVLT